MEEDKEDLCEGRICWWMRYCERNVKIKGIEGNFKRKRY